MDKVVSLYKVKVVNLGTEFTFIGRVSFMQRIEAPCSFPQVSLYTSKIDLILTFLKSGD